MTFEQGPAQLLELDARRVDLGQPEDVSRVVLADPEGKEPCLLSRSLPDLEAGPPASGSTPSTLVLWIWPTGTARPLTDAPPGRIRRLCHDGRMPSRLATLTIDALDPGRVARFWCEVLDWTVLERDEHIVSIGPVESYPGPGVTIDVIKVPERKTVKNRVHLDLKTSGGDPKTGGSTEVEELARLQELGATRIDLGQPDDATWVVLADPEGNEFCLLLPRPERGL